MTFCVFYPALAAASGATHEESELASRELVLLFEPTNVDSPRPADTVDAARDSRRDPTLHMQLGRPITGRAAAAAGRISRMAEAQSFMCADRQSRYACNG